MARNARLTHLHPLVRSVRLHLRLFASIAIGLVTAVALPTGWPLATRILTAWDMALMVYMLATIVVVLRCDLSHLRQRAAEEDEGAVAITFLAGAAALASLGAIVLELAAAKANPSTMSHHIALAIATITLSWLFTHTIFAQHYAHDYYSQEAGSDGGLAFPGNDAPDYWDFMYFSLVIGMTSQVSDVAVTDRWVRRTVAAHGVLAFVFNTTIIALTVNIAAGAF